ncbi:glycosyltransferase family A protein [Pedobacter aquatilis]|uniref:glycosyltransferase family 2 protein n=1 Tax=Pedobacter aquatilis TaxID=351343 RepID=UPI002931F083|nr:glycosyltransferase family A protein [Pedobacter aquatilis]
MERINRSLISVVIPVYNASKTILNTLESVKNQTFKDFDIVVVNDGSTDNSDSIVNDFILNNPMLEINYIVQENAGVSAARNCGLKFASGSWIALLDSDDQWLPTKLERQMEVIKANSDIEFLGTSRNGEIIKSNVLNKESTLTKIDAKYLLLRMLFITPTIIFKREILNDVSGFPSHQNFCEDGNFYIRICKRGHSYFLNESLVITGGGKAHFGEKGLSSNLWGMEIGELQNIKLACELGIINNIQYPFFVSFSLLKYLRRVVIVAKNSMSKPSK